MKRRRVLLVDDDPSILVSGAAILRQNGYDVTAADTVAEALNTIAHESVHILVSDLNVGQPGDGFTIVSALRRTQPDAIALIATGYPAFEKALQAIREQVDDFLLKPVEPSELVQAIKSLSSSRREHVALQSKRMPDIVRENQSQLIERVLDKLRRLATAFGKSTLPDQALIDHLPAVLDELCRSAESGRTLISTEAVRSSVAHGETRAQQGLDFEFILAEGAALRQEILAAVHRSLLYMDLSSLFLDLSKMSESLDSQVQTAVSHNSRVLASRTQSSK
jgi:response regulator RpfG family c-di-GMP phosphodiesterase